MSWLPFCDCDNQLIKSEGLFSLKNWRSCSESVGPVALRTVVRVHIEARSSPHGLDKEASGRDWECSSVGSVLA